MLKCEILDVQGFDPAIHGMRNPKNSWDKSDSYDAVDCGKCGLIEEKGVCNKEDRLGRCDNFRCYAVGDNDLKLMKTLFNAGTEHRKYDRMIQVWMDIEAPLYWWKEFDTYKIGTVANSCSTMHKIAEKEFNWGDFSNEHLTHTDSHHMDENEDAMNALQVVINSLNYNRNKYLETKDKKYWWQMIQLLPSSYNQKRTVMMNYEVIARIIEQRSHHKLDEWHQLIDVLSGLPYMQELMK
jgi:hypothetical protein